VRTKTIIAALVFLVGLTLFASGAAAEYENTYFPLKVGNEWVYVVGGTDARTTVSVDGFWRSPISGETWHRLRNFNGDYHWLNQTATGAVYEWPRQLWYRFGLGAGWPWTMSIEDRKTIPCSEGARLEIVSRNEQVKVPAGVFSTIHVRFRSSCQDAGITDEWFARGVGLVMRTQRAPLGRTATMMLERALISGRAVCATCD
jgi:hypothetical protein